MQANKSNSRSTRIRPALNVIAIQPEWLLMLAAAVVLLAAATPGRAATATVSGASLLEQTQSSFTPRGGWRGTALTTGRLSIELRVTPACEVALRPNTEGNTAVKSMCSPVSTAWMANAYPRDATPKALVLFEPRDADSAVHSAQSPGWLQRDAVFQLDY